MEKLILDANFLLLPFQFSVDIVSEIERIFGEVELSTLDLCVEEAKRVENARYAEKVDALIERLNIKILVVERQGHTDLMLLDYARSGYIIATNDADLRSMLLKEGLRVLYMREKSYLELEGE